jgi:hypothetical protein
MDHLKDYYVGDPEPNKKRGRDKFGRVHCLLWLIVYSKGDFFAKPNEHSLGNSGSGIGKAKNLMDAREKLHHHAVERLERMKTKTENELKRINKALEQLGDDPANLEQFVKE